jgi:hypothetical protein
MAEPVEIRTLKPGDHFALEDGPDQNVYEMQNMGDALQHHPEGRKLVYRVEAP